MFSQSFTRWKFPRFGLRTCGEDLAHEAQLFGLRGRHLASWMAQGAALETDKSDFFLDGKIGLSKIWVPRYQYFGQYCWMISTLQILIPLNHLFVAGIFYTRHLASAWQPGLEDLKWSAWGANLNYDFWMGNTDLPDSVVQCHECVHGIWSCFFVFVPMFLRCFMGFDMFWCCFLALDCFFVSIQLSTEKTPLQRTNFR